MGRGLLAECRCPGDGRAAQVNLTIVIFLVKVVSVRGLLGRRDRSSPHRFVATLGQAAGRRLGYFPKGDVVAMDGRFIGTTRLQAG